jgi:predicted RNA-binding protein YlxR (DUF448 family)
VSLAFAQKIAMSDDDDLDAEETGPTRRCAATGVVQAKERMIRFVVAPDGTATPDVAERLPGRGVWITADANALALATKKNAFARSTRQPVTVPADLAGQVRTLLVRQLVDLLGLARRAGELTAGRDKVEEALSRGPSIAVLLEAADGSPTERARLRAKAPGATVVASLDGATLARALGREGVVVHAVVRSGRLADRIVAAATRLAGLDAPHEERA